MDLEADEVRLLAELGFAAAGHGLAPEAEAVFAALELWRPEEALAGIGRALLALHAGRFDEAVLVLRREALARDPENRHAQALLGLALHLNGHKHEAVRLLREAADKDAAAGEEGLAAALLAARPA